jgi:hypothetical protein
MGRPNLLGLGLEFSAELMASIIYKMYIQRVYFYYSQLASDAIPNQVEQRMTLDENTHGRPRLPQVASG